MTEEIRKQEETITYDIFKSYFKENSELDNKELYDKFPSVNQGTIRNWKSKARKIEPEKPPVKLVVPEETQMQDFVDTLKNTLKGRVPQYLLNATEDMDLTSAYAVLKAHSESLEAKGDDPNTPITPMPTGGRRQNKRVIDRYLDIDPNKFEINLNIPGSVAFDPEKNKQLGDWE